MRKHRIFCLALTLVFLMSLLPAQAAAADTHPNTYRNTGNARMDILGVARTQIGYREGAQNNTKYGKWYGMNYNPWCAMFVSWCANRAGISTNVIQKGAVATPGATGFDIPYYHGSTYTPKPGDLFFTEEFSHTGLVYHVDGAYFYTIEGNTDNYELTEDEGVYCKRRKISEFYFGVPAYPEAEALPAPTVTTQQKQYELGEDVTVSWTEVEGAVSYHITVYYQARIVLTADMGTETAYTISQANAGDYLVSVSAKYENGREGFGQYSFEVVTPPSLTANYNANGGKITPVHQYVVANNSGVNFRANYSTSSTKLGRIPAGTQLVIEKMVDSGGYTWGYTCYNGRYGWCALNGLCQRTGYGLDDCEYIVQYPSGMMSGTFWYSGADAIKTLPDCREMGLSKEFHSFAGWSVRADGSAPALGLNGAGVAAAQVEPTFSETDMTVTLYALWEKIVDAIAVESGPAKTEYYADETLDTTGLGIRVSYADGTEEILYDGFAVTGFDSGTTGKQVLTVSCGGKEASFTVNVDARLRYTEDENAAVITGYVQGNGGTVTVPAQIDGMPVKAIAAGAFANCDKITAVIVPASVTRIGESAFSGCTALATVNYTGSREQWEALDIAQGNETLINAALTCDYMVPGDFTGDMRVDNSDIIYLLWHTLFPEQFSVAVSADLNGDGKVNNDDVIVLLWHSLFPDNFPLGRS